MALRAAIVGFGRVAENAHLPAYLENGIEVSAVCESDPGRVAAARKKIGSARFYASYEQLLKNETGLEFVAIATPPYLHAAQALAALRAGFHVLCEKPLALTPQDLNALAEAARAADRCVFTVHNWAYSPQWIKVEELVASGAVGEVRHVELRALRTKPAASAVAGDWRRQARQAGGGILIDHGWHNLYMVHRLLKSAPLRVTARLSGAPDGVEDEAAVFMEFDSATALVYLSWRSPIRRNAAMIAGTNGIIELGDDEIVLRRDSGARRFSFAQPLSAGSAHPEWLSKMLPDFLVEMSDRVRRGGNLAEAAACSSTIAQAYDRAPEPALA